MQHAIVVEEVSNPSTEYFVLPHLRRFARSVTVITHGAPLPEEQLHNAHIIFVRYIPANWQRFVARNRKKLAGVIYFMDDDLLDWSASSGMASKYRIKLYRLAATWQSWLRKTGAQLWVSTPYLADKYANWQPLLVSPCLEPTSNTAPLSAVKIFYHGSASHRAEIEWLVPVMEKVLTSMPTVNFEIIGNLEINRLYRKLPRVNVVHPMSWPNFRDFCNAGVRHIGLAPLLEGPFNAARSHTKFFDIYRCGAAGIYSDMPPFQDFIQHGEDGLLLDNNPEIWVQTLCFLASKPSERERLIAGAQRRISQLQQDLMPQY